MRCRGLPSELAAVDYLLKPFSDERFRQAVEHARHRSIEELSGRMMDLLRSAGRVNPDYRESSPASLEDRNQEVNPSPLVDRIAVQRRGEIKLVSVEDIIYFGAEGAYVNVHTAERTHLIRERMKTLEKRLPPGNFCRIHRSTIVNLDWVEALEPTDPGDVVARLRTGKRLRVSRSRRKEMEKRLGL